MCRSWGRAARRANRYPIVCLELDACDATESLANRENGPRPSRVCGLRGGVTTPVTTVNTRNIWQQHEHAPRGGSGAGTRARAAPAGAARGRQPDSNRTHHSNVKYTMGPRSSLRGPCVRGNMDGRGSRSQLGPGLRLRRARHHIAMRLSPHTQTHTPTAHQDHSSSMHQ